MDKGTSIKLSIKWALICLFAILPLIKPTIIYAKHTESPNLYFPINQPIELPESAKLAIAKAQAEQEALAKQKALQVALKAKKPPTNARLPYDPCSCISYAKWLSGINVGSMSLFGPGIGAKNHPTNSQVPVVGGLVIFKGGVGMSNNGHAATVIEVDGNKFTTKGGNEVSCVVGTIRHYDLGVDYVKIKGFYNL